jgi:hypothetical protein
LLHAVEHRLRASEPDPRVTRLSEKAGDAAFQKLTQAVCQQRLETQIFPGSFRQGLPLDGHAGPDASD